MNLKMLPLTGLSVYCPIIFLSLWNTASAKLPPNHEFLIDDYLPHFRCPYSKKWLKDGPVKAARDLGLVTANGEYHNNHRKAQQENTKGSCSFTSPWSGPSCFEMRGSDWTEESMTERCDQDDTKGALSIGAGCEQPSTTGGWCIVNKTELSVEASIMLLGGPMTCTTLAGACTGFARGVFEAAPGSECDKAGDSESNTSSGTASEFTPNPIDGGVCVIAPGPIGAAHQDGFSDGYSAGCPGTPAEGSPYMWPIRWAADVHIEAMAFGSDEITYESYGRSYYLMNKNWKRGDINYQSGRSPGGIFLPCGDPTDENYTDDECMMDANTNKRTTVLHRGSLMYFIDWSEDSEPGVDDISKITSCTWLSLQVIGNVRPDWFMDDRGSSTDVQYLGDQHVYHNGKPRLVKQWRKKDFASQYFTMSMQANVGDDGVHWPLILNIPGEGFGDDLLQEYGNHTLLTDEDEGLFLLDEAYIASGGTCIPSAEVSPEEQQKQHIPSNLEVDPYAWETKIYTFSPIWKPPLVVDDATSTSDAAIGFTQAGSSTSLYSCYDSSSNSVQLKITYETEDPSSWLGLSFRDSEECTMTPTGGGSAEFILISDGDTASHGALQPSLKSFSSSLISSIFDDLVPLDEVDGYGEVDVTNDEKSVTLQFTKMVEGPSSTPDVLYLNYAYGSSPTFGYHSSRGCFEVRSFPSCSTDKTETDSSSASYPLAAFSFVVVTIITSLNILL